MKVLITLTEQLIKPLLEEHLETGKAVQTLIADAISFHQICKAEVVLGKAIVSGTLKNGYVNDKCLLMKPEEILTEL